MSIVASGVLRQNAEMRSMGGGNPVVIVRLDSGKGFPIEATVPFDDFTVAGSYAREWKRGTPCSVTADGLLPRTSFDLAVLTPIGDARFTCGTEFAL